MPGRIAVISIVAMLIALAAPAAAQDYPSRPIRILVTSGPGGLMDVMTRLLAIDLGIRLGQSIVVENRPGAMTQVAADTLVRSAPDGYTLMIGSSEMAMLPFLKKGYRYDPLKDFTPVALVANSWTVFAVNPKVPAQTLPELIAYAKANPGKIRYGSGGTGGAPHIAVEMLKLKAGIDLVHVPYRGGAQVATDAISGQIEMASMGLASTRIADKGQLRILAQTGPSRHPMVPDVPTTAEFGLPDVRMDTWFSLIAPAGLPEPIVRRLVGATAAVTNDAGFRDKLSAMGLSVSFKPRAEFGAYIAAETRRWSEIIPAMGISVEE
jgi:tripartite-type tricarboxylate transporter receptor subunit TctC